MLLRELAATLQRDNGVLSRWETGERTPKPEQVAQILTKLGVDGDLYDDIMTLAYGTDEPQWVATTLPEQRQQMIAYVDREQKATHIVEVAPLLVPGLLQTTDYINAIMTAGGVPTGEITDRITYRIGRRNVIDKPKPAELLVLLGQHALDQDVGGKPVTVEQTQHLREMAAKPNIELRIMPDGCGWHPGLEGPFTLIHSDGADIVFVETRRSLFMLHEEGDVAAYRRAVDRIMRITLDPDSSIKFLAGLSNRLEKKRGT